MSWPGARNVMANLVSRGDKHREVISQVSSPTEGMRLPTLNGENRGDPIQTRKGPMPVRKRTQETTAFDPGNRNSGSPSPGPQSSLPC